MTALVKFERDQQRARDARRQAAYLRDLHGTATCGLPMQFTGIHYGNRQVWQSVAMRVADMYLVWADEYEAIAGEIERSLESSLAGLDTPPTETKEDQ